MPGPLAELMPLRLADLTAPVIEAWAAKEAKDRPARVRLALRLLKTFLRWAATEPDLKGRADPTAASAKKAREVAGKAKPKNDYLQREQLPVWFEYVRQIQNPVIAAYLQCLLLTGARREELAELKWEDVNFQWRGMELKDKSEGRRAVPLTPYVAHLLAALPRRNEWVFSSTGSKSGRLTEPSIAHRQACAAAGLELTLHGLPTYRLKDSNAFERVRPRYWENWIVPKMAACSARIKAAQPIDELGYQQWQHESLMELAMLGIASPAALIPNH